jgi:hypothetical protein
MGDGYGLLRCGLVRLATGESLRNIDLCRRSDGVTQVDPVHYLASVHKHHHVRPYCTLIIQHVASRLWVLLEHSLEYLPHCITFHLAGRAVDVALNVGSERNCWHVQKNEK